MLSDKITDESTQLHTKYDIHLYLWRYLLMPNADKFMDSIVICLERGFKAFNEYRENSKDNATLL
jgi:hypothetical protein